MATIMEGSLSKWTNVMKGWQFRWFVLDDNAGLLSYYTSREKMIRGVRRGCVRLKGAVIGIDDEDDSTFTITVDSKTFHFQARDADEREKWIRALEDTILRHAHKLRWDPSKPAPSVQDFDKKLVEADAYLQILIDQIEALEDRIDKMQDPSDKSHGLHIRDHANSLLENVKHSIVLLQIAKNTAHPVNGIFQPATSSYTLNDSSPTSKQDSALSVTGGAHRPSMTLLVPDISYSSSEDEDFYDANDYTSTPNSVHSGLPLFSSASELDAAGRTSASPLGRRESEASSASQAHGLGHGAGAVGLGAAGPGRGSIAGEQRRHGVPPLLSDGSLDYDALYEDEDESDLGPMEAHGSVVTHLLSQVKIGMDLTRVVLPTFILERRSLLEMYSDYFAHPDYFLKIADFKDPRDRMVQVVRWYMSAYHAGRKSSVAKKPYNPILGEIFYCHWNVPDISTGNEPLVTDGPVPWCDRNQLTFIAEQVSHHPPISAFYAEHYNKRISFCAHVWTKSKFLGLSVGVHNIGQGCVSVLEYDEEYIVTFPNGYGRSILTVPWIELGGPVTIACAKTGFNATIEFHTKPFYGGKKHRISGEVFQPGEKKPFLSISGEWNGSMHSKWADGRTELFLDVNEIPIIKKEVRPISDQDEMESRRLWKEVTAGLRLNDIDKATNAKTELEQRQREEAKDRKERNLRWETKCFRETGDNWVYVAPLIARLSRNGTTGTTDPHAASEQR
ncbi:oxysterol-binding protein-related protein 9 isoform X2 [Thrips palmi]|uniref:Oxysterol-binding protein n=1 Tax=Thrips palmi TaxID=161013 RepID=A0A6P8Z8W5_THRPL|nr:oxysterol-binding protein-related protein 9 isoform X2 [Thrips palmi]